MHSSVWDTKFNSVSDVLYKYHFEPCVELIWFISSTASTNAFSWYGYLEIWMLYLRFDCLYVWIGDSYNNQLLGYSLMSWFDIEKEGEMKRRKVTILWTHKEDGEVMRKEERRR